MGIFLDISDGRAFRRDPLAFLSVVGDFRDVIRFRAGLSDFTLVNHPDLIRRVLVTDARSYGEGKWTLRGKHVMHDCLITREGTPHHERRGLVGPGFDRRRLAQFGPALVRCAERVTTDWQSGQRIEAREAMGRMAITMAGIALFDADVEGEALELNHALVILNDAISRLPLPRPKVAAAHRRVERTAASFLGGHLASHLRDNGMSEDAVLNELISLMMAAVDTTPRALAWVWFLEANLSMPKTDHYIARELVQAEPLTHESARLLDANPWVLKELPNASSVARPVKALWGGKLLQRIFEYHFRGKFGARCERKAREIAALRLRTHHGKFDRHVPEDVQRGLERGVELRFHGAPRVNDCLERYEKNRTDLRLRLRETGRAESASSGFARR